MPNDAEAGHAATAAVNQEAVARYDMDDRQDFADASVASSPPYPERWWVPTAT